MRLDVFDTQAKLSSKLIAQVVRFVFGFSPDIVKVLLYRGEFFGKAFNDMLYEVMRADEAWTPGEREAMAAFVSMRNHCRYCTDVHQATAAAYLDQDTIGAVLADPKTAPIDDKLRATLAFLEKLTVSPRSLTPLDLQELRRTGVTDDQIENAVEVCVHFCIINRLADAFGFRLETPSELDNHAATLVKRNYKF
jgi:uncharacterized peroxidase-related enzyme